MKVKQEPAAEEAEDEDGEEEEKKKKEVAGKFLLHLRPRAPPLVIVHEDQPKRTQLTLEQTVRQENHRSAERQRVAQRVRAAWQESFQAEDPERRILLHRPIGLPPAAQEEKEQAATDMEIKLALDDAANSRKRKAGKLAARLAEEARREGEGAKEEKAAEKASQEEDGKATQEDAKEEKAAAKKPEAEQPSLAAADEAALWRYAPLQRLGKVNLPLSNLEMRFLVSAWRNSWRPDAKPSNDLIREILANGIQQMQLDSDRSEQMLRNFSRHFANHRAAVEQDMAEAEEDARAKTEAEAAKKDDAEAAENAETAADLD